MNVGETARFTVRATGSAPLSYQWRKNAVNIPGATAPNYTTPPAVADDNGSLFSVVVSNPVGSVTSAAKKLNVKLPPTIIAQPGNKTVTVGKTATFKVTVTGTTPLTYQWKKNGVDIAGGTKAAYTIPPATKADSGSVFVVTVANAFGSATSDNATLTVN